MKNIVFILSIFTLSIGCNNDIEGPYIDEDLVPYVDEFIEEAAARGLIIDKDSLDLQIFLTNIPNANIQGQCVREPGEINLIQIDKNFFRAIDDLRKEFLVFHELGHCVLNRLHEDDSDTNGNCISIMHSGGASCNDTYSLETRSDFLDELF